MQKTALRYHRFSDKNQSNGSIERQDMVTTSWANHNNIRVLATFNDDGYSAKTFDRPDVKKLFMFIEKNKSQKIDYLIVSELTRFSRELGEAVTTIKKIQTLYGVRIVSATRNFICDVFDPMSFQMMSLEFMFGNTENLKRELDINGGIYTAKAKEHRFIGSRAPYGYKKEGTGKNVKLVAVPEEAEVVLYAFNAFIDGLSLKDVLKTMRTMGFQRQGNSVLQKLLTNPIYTGRQYVKAWKNHPGGLYEVNAEKLIDLQTFDIVQQKLKRNNSRGTTVSDAFPLRNVLLCHCGKPLTGAPSRGKLGKYYDYYKCNGHGHTNNLSAKKAHQSMEEIFHHLSIPADLLQEIRDEALTMLKEVRQEQKKKLSKVVREHAEVSKALENLEEKFIYDKISPETYQRWHQSLSQQLYALSSQINEINADDSHLMELFEQNMSSLSNLDIIWNLADTPLKQSLVRLVFDNRLYFKGGTYRTPYILELLNHNHLILKHKRLLEIDKKGDSYYMIPQGGAAGNPIEQIAKLLSLISSIKVA
ncbi:MAG TPA: recombinase family protein [Ferruginibacter sp.]|nr:recombinase family protein [Ferruginibacter sp.]HRQ20555.1 recombinase family protein [Ferruginibacter sp.]